MSSPHSELLSLLRELFSTSCITIASDLSVSEELRSTSLLLDCAQVATTAELASLLLQILLSQPPFTHVSPSTLASHHHRFSEIWVQNHSFPSLDDDDLPPGACLKILSGIRLEFQRLNEKGFGFVAELLLDCLTQLCPEGAHRNFGVRGWVASHDCAVTILGELLHAIPVADWQDLDAHSRHILAVWKCLQLLCSGASWWSIENLIYKENIVRLARYVFSIPTASSLCRAALRIDMSPGEIHNIVSTLLDPLERRLGVPCPPRINAFTPTPFAFPMLASLDRHEFNKDYEFASLRVLFAGWLTSSRVHRDAEYARNPWSMEAVLQHSEAFKRLQSHPQSAVRVALIYIFNQTQLGSDRFKPSTDLKAIELLKMFIKHRHLEGSSPISPAASRITLPKDLVTEPEGCVTAHADWTMPWIWRRRATDTDFSMVITSAWLTAACSIGGRLNSDHAVFKLVMKNADSACAVFHDFFRHIFIYDFVACSPDPEATLKQIRKLFKIVMDLILLLAVDSPAVLNQHMCMMIIRCCMESLDKEWIPVDGWGTACEALSQVAQLTLSEATKLAQISMQVELLVPIFLRYIEVITTACDDTPASGLPVDDLTTQFENLTVQTQYLTLLTKSNGELCRLISLKSHFITSAIQYINKCYTHVLALSPKPELSWMHAASVASLIELLAVVDFGVPKSNATKPTNLFSRAITIKDKEFEAGKMIRLLVGRNFEMSYSLAPLCGLVKIISKEWWTQNPFAYLGVCSLLRNYLLEQEIHRWCAVLPAIVDAFGALLSLKSATHEQFLSSRWNLALCTKLLGILFSTSHCPTCSTPLSLPITDILSLYFTRQPPWQTDLLQSSGLGRYSMLDYPLAEKRVQEFIDAEQMAEAHALIRVLQTFGTFRAKATVLGSGLERTLRANGRRRDGGTAGAGAGGCYRVWKPVEGGVGVLVPTYRGRWMGGL